MSDTATLGVLNDQGAVRIPEIDLEMRRNTEEWYSCRDHDFHSLRGISRTERELRRDDWQAEVITRTELMGDAENFYIHARLDAYENRRRIFSDNWHETIRRNMV